MEKRFCVTHQFNHSVVHNLICKVNKHVALWLQLDSMALCVLLSATILEVSYFNNFAIGFEHKGLSAFTDKFPSSTAGLHLVLNTSCLRKKSRLVQCVVPENIHTPPTGRFFRFNPPSTRNFHSRGVCEDPPYLLEFPFFLHPHFRTPQKFQVVFYLENWRFTEVQSILFIPLLRYLRFILSLIRKKIFTMFDFVQ